MDMMTNLPRLGSKEALSQILERQNEIFLPARFVDYVAAHLEAGHAFKDTQELQAVVGACVLCEAPLGEKTKLLDAVNKAIASDLPSDVAAQYAKLKQGFHTMLGIVDLS